MIMFLKIDILNGSVTSKNGRLRFLQGKQKWPRVEGGLKASLVYECKGDLLLSQAWPLDYVSLLFYVI